MSHDTSTANGTVTGSSLRALLWEYRQLGYYALSLGLFLLAWQVMAMWFASGLVPRISPVAAEMWTITESGAFFTHLVDTLRRVAIGFLLAFGVSVPLGIAMGLDERAEYLAEIPILIGVSVPGLAVAILAIIWFGLAEMTAYVSVFLLATPMIVFNFWQGTKSIDQDLIEMGTVFEAGWLRIARHIILPSLLPHLLSAARFGLALSWKIVVIVELLGLTSGIGYMINSEFQLYSIVGVMAWTLNFTIVMMCIEFGLLKTLERRVTRWRGDNQGEMRA
jgi:NitT/TauT family transport system permease protein